MYLRVEFILLPARDGPIKPFPVARDFDNCRIGSCASTPPLKFLPTDNP